MKCRTAVFPTTPSGRPYQAAVDAILQAMNDSRAPNEVLAVRELSFRHAGRRVTVFYGKNRQDKSALPALRMLAVSLDATVAESPDNSIEPFLRQLKDAIGERGPKADETLQAITSSRVGWNANG